MPTRATLTIADKTERYHIYRHHDGYPDGEHGVIRSITSAQSLAWPVPRFEAGDFAAALVAIMKQTAGSIYLTQNADDHDDRNFHYQITSGVSGLYVAVQYTEWLDPQFTKFEMRTQFEGVLADAANLFDPCLVQDQASPKTPT